MLSERDGDEECTPDGDDRDAQVRNGDNEDARLAVGARVRVYPGTEAESCGVVVDDFGEASGRDVRRATRIAGAARQWAVLLDDGTLVFADSEQIATK